MQSQADGAASASRSKWRTATLWFGFVLLLAAIVYVLLTFRWAELTDVLAETDVLLFVGGGGATILAYWLLRAARWSVLLGAVHENISFKELYLSTGISLGLAIVTPLQSGEAGKVEWLKRRGKLDRKMGYSAYALERLLDLGVVCAFGLIGLGGKAWSTSLFPWLLAAIAVGVACLIGIARGAHLGSKFAGFIDSFRALTADTGMLLKVVGLTIAAWLVIALGWRICLASLSITLSAVDTITLVGLVTIANILSFVPGAWGISEIGIAQFLTATGYEPVAAQAGAIIIRGYGILTLVIAMLHLPFAREFAALATRRADEGRQG